MYAAHPLHFRRFGAIPVQWTTAGVFRFTAANWSRATFELRAYLRTTSGNAYARVYNETDGSEVAQLNTTSSTLTWVLKAATLSDGKTYSVQFGSSDGSSCRWQSFDLYMI